MKAPLANLSLLLQPQDLTHNIIFEVLGKLRFTTLLCLFAFSASCPTDFVLKPLLRHLLVTVLLEAKEDKGMLP